jgi:vacuolar-type H+-ATPase subunit I/STV1
MVTARGFLTANSFIIGTVIVVSGFLWMVIQSLAAEGVPFSLTLTAFFYTISGIIFWGIAYNLSNKGEKVATIHLGKKHEEKPTNA